MNKNRIEGFLVSLETGGILKADQQSMVMQSELESVGCGENVNCTNAVAVCGGSSVFNKAVKISISLVVEAQIRDVIIWKSRVTPHQITSANVLSKTSCLCRE